MTNLERYGRSCNTLDDLSAMTYDPFHKVCPRKKTVDMNVQPCNFLSTINESKSLVKHTLRDCCKCRFDGECFI